MRVVEPKQFKYLPKKRKKKPVWGYAFLLLVIAIGTGYIIWNKARPAPQPQSNPAETLTAPTPTLQAPKKGTLKQFTGEQFKELYYSTIYPNTQQFPDPPDISGNIEADLRIRQLAEARGYKLTSIPVQAIVKINEPRLEGDDLLQPLAAESWQQLKASATKDGYPLALISAYRAPEYQRKLFMDRLLARGVTVLQLARAQGDAAIKANLEVTAVPGYSRHHTGYTIDVWCEDGSTAFLNSSCYKWISANNYEKAKEAGWIPSYPEGANEQGPEPEPWEYVWVGRDRLTE
jgi:zinc D-Ala-D-Ala carboxypeptidase